MPSSLYDPSSPPPTPPPTPMSPVSQRPFVLLLLSARYVPRGVARLAAWHNDDLRGLAELLEDTALIDVLDALGGPPTRREVAVSALWLRAKEARARRAGAEIKRSLTQHWRIDLSATPERVDEALDLLAALPEVRRARRLPLLSNPSPSGAAAADATVVQVHLGAAPKGVGASCAWSRKLHGQGVGFMDLERAWHPASHVELPSTLLSGGKIVPKAGANVSGALVVECGGTMTEDGAHGIKALGVVLGEKASSGYAGLARKAKVRGVVSYVSTDAKAPYKMSDAYENLTEALLAAGRMLKAGDVLLLEVQAVVPDEGTCQVHPVDALEAVRDAIALLIAAGVTVIEPAGDGSLRLPDVTSDLDPGSLSFEDSGAIMVGASAYDGAKQRRMGSSNTGRRLNCFAPGAVVGTTSGNALFTGAWHEHSTLGDTSGAAAVIAGVAILVQCWHKDRGLSPLSPSALRTLLSNFKLGTAAYITTMVGGAPVTVIDLDLGAMPDLCKIFAYLEA